MVCVFHRGPDCTCFLHWCTARCVSFPHLYYPASGQVGILWSCSPSLLVCFSSDSLHNTFYHHIFSIVPFIVDLQDYKPPQRICWIKCANCEAHIIVSGFPLLNSCICSSTAASPILWSRMPDADDLWSSNLLPLAWEAASSRGCCALPPFGICPWARLMGCSLKTQSAGSRLLCDQPPMLPSSQL